jgi:hypothetical protein
VCRKIAAPWLKRLVAGFPLRQSGFEPGSGKWDLWWTKWRWGRFSPSTSVSPTNLHSAKFSIITVTWGRYRRPFSGRCAKWTQFHHPLCEMCRKCMIKYAFTHTLNFKPCMITFQLLT